MTISILEKDLEVTFVRASGPGGQHRNTRETGVRVHHIPSGITVVATERRSQLENKKVAMHRLYLALSLRAKKRKKRIATKASRASQERRLKEKTRRSGIKAARGKVSASDD